MGGDLGAGILLRMMTRVHRVNTFLDETCAAGTHCKAEALEELHITSAIPWLVLFVLGVFNGFGLSPQCP